MLVAPWLLLRNLFFYRGLSLRRKAQKTDCLLYTSDTISTEVVAAILDHVVVCEGSTKQRIDLELYLRLGQTASVTFSRERFAFWNTSCLLYTSLLFFQTHVAFAPN